MSALRLKGSSLAGVGVVVFQTLLPSQAEKEYSSEQLGILFVQKHAIYNT